MSEEHTDNLKKARARLIEQRRAFVKVLAGPYERGKTEQARERFLESATSSGALESGNLKRPVFVNLSRSRVRVCIRLLTRAKKSLREVLDGPPTKWHPSSKS